MNELSTNHQAEAPPRPPTLTDRVLSLRLPDRPARQFNGLVLSLATLCLVFAGSTGFLAWRLSAAPAQTEEHLEGKPKANTPRDPQPGQPQAAPEPGAVALTSKGYIIPYQQIQVSPKVGGTILKLNIIEGKRVKKGDMLAEIEAVDYKADYDRAVAVVESANRRWQELWKYREDEIRQARAELDDSKTQREQLLADWRRNITLRNANALAAKEYDQSESSYKSMDFRVERLKLSLDLLIKGPRDERIGAAFAEVDQAKADLAKVKFKLDNCTVRAPIDGIILSKKAEEGNQVNPAAFSNGLSASLCDMADLTDMEVDLAIAERDIGKLFKGQVCQVKAEAFPDRPYAGVVSRIMPTGDRGKSAVPVRVKIFIDRAEEGQFLRPEMGALVTFYNEKKQ